MEASIVFVCKELLRGSVLIKGDAIVGKRCKMRYGVWQKLGVG